MAFFGLVNMDPVRLEATKIVKLKCKIKILFRFSLRWFYTIPREIRATDQNQDPLFLLECGQGFKPTFFAQK
jgi:hypothetical protein